MRIFLLLFSLTISTYSFANELHCNTTNRGNAWNLRDRQEYLYLYSDMTPEGVLISPYMHGSYDARATISRKIVNFYPGARDFIGYDRFEPLIGNWHSFYLLLPHNYEKRKSRFIAYLQVFEQNFFQRTIKMNCMVHRYFDI